MRLIDQLFEEKLLIQTYDLYHNSLLLFFFEGGSYIRPKFAFIKQILLYSKP